MFYEYVETEEAIKGAILDRVSDLVSDFLYYDRKEDEGLPLDEIEKAIENEIISIEEIVQHFESCLKKGL